MFRKKGIQMVRRIYVEKKEGFDIEAAGILNDIKGNLHISSVDDVRVINRYDVEGISDDTYEKARCAVFAEPAVDTVCDETLPDGPASVFFATEFLPGQYDQRADSAAQCIKLIDPSAEATVRFARVIVLVGDIKEHELETIKNYIINPVDSREASLGKPDTLAMEMQAPAPVAVVDGFCDMTDDEAEAYRKEMGFAMSKDDILFVREHFRNEEKRNPTITELKVIDTYWSDHCRHTTFNTKITDVQFEDGPYADIVKKAFEEYLDMRREVYGERESEKDVCLMDLAVIGAKYMKKHGLLDDLDESDEINACSIKVTADVEGNKEDWIVMFKNETHNHPTEIEPFGGAATCLGGAIRDPLSGRSYVYQAMRVTGAADPRTPVSKTLAGKLPQRKITTEAAAGYSSYGNQIGLATGQVTEIYDPDYVAKRMEVGAVIGAAPADHIRREAPKPGDAIILVGGRTGRDGCGGATGSSKEHTEESITECGSEVQKGNALTERSIQRMFRRKEVAQMIKRCNDFGAGGVSVAIGELADSIDVALDTVPKKYEGLDGTELAISESQERMAVVVEKENAAQFIAYANEENLEATVVAEVTDSGRFRMFFRDQKILDLSRAFLNTNGVKQETKVLVRSSDKFKDIFADKKEVKALDFLSDLNCCSQKGLTERFDSTIGGNTVLMPLGGKNQLTPTCGMAAKLPVIGRDTTTATLMAYGFDPQISKQSTFHGAMYAVIDSVTKIAAMGGDISKVRLSFQEFFEKMTNDPTVWSKPFAALLGALTVQKKLGIAAIGGKDSMSGTFMDINVPPTLISFAVGTVNADIVISPEFKREDSRIVYLYPGRDENNIIDFDNYIENMKCVKKLAIAKNILAANVIGKGGIFISLVKMAAGNSIGVEIDNITEEELKCEDYGGLLLEIPAEEDIRDIFTGTTYKVIGKTTSKGLIDISSLGVTIGLSQAIKDWCDPLEGVFPTRNAEFRRKKDDTIVPKISCHQRTETSAAIKIAKPRVLIPVFPGTNCEVESMETFKGVGAEVDVHIIRNMTEHDLEDSIRDMEKKIRASQIVMLPGGFSGGDEPDGSAKFITAVFRNPRISDAVTELLEQHDGLMLGICNGFQALIKLGLLPYGKITDMTDDSPTLTYNRIGRHMSRLVRTRIASVKSPWLAGVNVGDIHTVAISHGEGRLIANTEITDELIKNGQIATQYVDLNGEPTMDIAHNPNGSVLAAEGLLSPDGRVFGKMGHSERWSSNAYKNVTGSKDQRIFSSGVNYFK